MFTAHLLYKLNFICKYLLYKIALYVLFFFNNFEFILVYVEERQK